MGKKGKRRYDGMVYSTSGSYDSEGENEEEESLPPNEQLLYVSIDRKQRKGKEVTLVEGFVGTTEDLSYLAKMLKSKCGVGGNAKDGDILIQGNKRDKVMEILVSEGYKVKRKGG